VPPEPSLCESCGLCCDGALFRCVGLTPDEARWARARGIELWEPGGAPALPQPCALLEGTRCTAYGSRPERCRRFECDMLAGYQRGELSLADCRARIERVRAFLSQSARAPAPPSDAAEQRRLRSETSVLLESAGLRGLIHASRS
jgi:hypothetical protein